MKKLKKFLSFFMLFLLFFIPSVYAEESCQGILGGELSKFIADTYNMICYIGLAISIILAFMDFFKVIAGDEKSGLKGVAAKLVKRLIAIAILLMLPQLLEWIFSLAGLNFDSCGV